MKFIDFDRGTETEQQIQKRLQNAKAELEQAKSQGLFDHMLVNDDLETCYASLKVGSHPPDCHSLHIAPLKSYAHNLSCY